MAAKKFTEKAGYENALDFDPVNGIVKFGSYEAFLKDLPVKPQKYQVTFDDYKKTLNSGRTGMGMLSNMMLPTSPKQDAKMRADFESAVMGGTFRPAKKSTNYFSMGSDTRSTGFEIDDGRPEFGLMGIPITKAKPTPTYRNITKLGPDSYSVEAYAVPDNMTDGYELLNEISRRASGMGRSQRSNTDALRQNQQDSRVRRQGAGSTILSGSAAATAINT